MTTELTQTKTESAIRFAQQAERLSLVPHDPLREHAGETAVEARFITPQDPIIETASGGRLPTVPIREAQKLNKLKDEVEGRDSSRDATASGGLRQSEQEKSAAMQERAEFEKQHDTKPYTKSSLFHSPSANLSLRNAPPPSQTNPLFPPLPLYGPSTVLRDWQCMSFRVSSFFLSLSFLGVIVLGSAFTSIPLMLRHVGLRLTGKNPDARRPFYTEEERRKKERQEAETAWTNPGQSTDNLEKFRDSDGECASHCNTYEPTEGGVDPLICDVGYYARRVGLDVEEFKVQTEDGFIITLWHVYNPKEYVPVSSAHRGYKKPEVFPNGHVRSGHTNGACGSQYKDGKRRYPVLLIHGLLQSSGAYCCNDDDSLAFFLCKRYNSHQRPNPCQR